MPLMEAAARTLGPQGIDTKLPSWDGEYGTFLDYRHRAYLMADGTKEEELPLLAPRLARNLTGRAWEVVPELDRSKLKARDGVDYLIGRLEELRGKERVDLLGDALSDFFTRPEVRRRDREELMDYLPRFRNYVREVEKSMKDSKIEGQIPKEVYGWFLLQYVRLDASDTAVIKSRVKTIKWKK